jgi:hypothetical protein
LQRTSVSACNSPLQSNNSNVVLQCITCASVLTSDNVSRTQLILKQQHERKCIACVKQPLMIDACQCVTCATLKHQVSFSNRQWSKPRNSRRCLSCVQHLMNDAGPAGNILIREHAMSNRMIDRQLHEVPGRKIRDRAACASAQDKEEAQQGMISFDPDSN